MNLIYLTLIVPLLLNPCEASKLNVPRILLPLFNNFPTNFTLEVTEGGCYTWTTLRPNTIQLDCVDPDPDSGCCSRVVVSSGIKELRRYTDTVLGEDVHSGVILRCDVILDAIRRLEIATTTRAIYLDDPPEAFEVRAYDEQGNEFSTLDGVEFDWSFRTLGAANKSGESTVIRYITFAESPYETRHALEPFERVGLKGHTVLLEARQTGAAAVTVRLPHTEYKQVGAVVVQLIVQTNLIITPEDATLLLGDDLQYRLQRLQQGRAINILFPSVQYHLISEDDNVELDKSSGIAMGLEVGKAKIVLVDGNVGAATEVKPPTASLTVATPHDLSLAVLPHRKWSVVVGYEYDLIAELHDTERWLFSLGSAVSIGIELDEKYFRIDHRTRNGSYVHGVPLRTGKTVVTGELHGVREPTGHLRTFGPLTATAELNIFEPIRVEPAIVLVPWDPTNRAKYEIPLKATGGDGSYTWSSHRSAVAVVNQRGIVKTLEQGMSVVAAAMTENLAIRGVSKIRVLPPTALEILDTALEGNVGSPIAVQIRLYADVDGVRTPFTVCDALPFILTLTESTFVRTNGNATRKDNACAVLFVKGNQAGTSQVTISYNGLSASVVVAAHPPLQPLNPSSGLTLLTVGSSRLIVFTGGPRSWALKPAENHHVLHNPDYDGEDIKVTEELSRSPLASKYAYAYKVTCRQLSETRLTLELVNQVVGSKSEPSIAKASVLVVCGKPKYLQLTALNKPGEGCPVLEEIYGLNSDQLELEVILKDAQGRRFDEFTSLEMVWTASKQIIHPLYKGVKPVTIQQDGFIFPNTHKQTVTSAGKSGVVELQVQVLGYDNAVLFAESITAEHPPFPEVTSTGSSETPDIRASVTIRLVEPIRLSPNSTDIFAGGEDVRDVEVVHGSGYFSVVPNGTGIVEFTTSRRSIQLKGLNMGSVVLEIRDVCLRDEPTSLNVQVYRIGAISLDVVEYIERNTAVWARVILYDEEGAALPSSPSPSALSLQPVAGSDIITAGKQESSVVPVGPGFPVRGVSLGQTTLAATAGRIVSAAVPVNVFSPLRLHPREVTLLSGSTFQVTVLDGPPGAQIEWSVDDQAVKVSGEGVLQGQRIGTCRLTAKAVTIRKSNGHRVVSSQDSIEVRVVPLKNIEIHAPITQLVVGGRMPLWAVGPSTSRPLHLASSTAVRFFWTLSHDTLAEIRSAFAPIGLDVPETDLAAVQLFAVKPGQLTVTLTVQVPGAVAGLSNPTEYTDSLTVQILADVGLSSPRPMVLEHLLVSTMATTELRTTRDVRGFQVTVLRGGPDVIKVTQDGTLTAGNKTGAAVVAIGRPDAPWRHLLVYVKPIEYIMANVIPKWRFKTDNKIQVLPNGLDLEINLSFHDNEGNTFDAVRSNVLVESEQKGLLSLVRGSQNKTVNLHILDSGATTVRLWDSRPAHQPSDYLYIRSGDVLYPAQARISVGDVLCLHMPVATNDNSLPSWVVDDPQKLRLWPNIGLAVAAGGVGVATISHRASSRLKSRVEISPITKIELLPQDKVLTSTAGTYVDHPIVLYATGEISKRNNLLSLNGTCEAGKDFTLDIYPFSCRLNFNNPAAHLDITELFSANPTFNLDTGLYSCRIAMSGKQTQLTATLTESIVLTALTSDSALQSRSTIVPFLPAVFLHQTELKVTSSKRSATFVVTGIPEVLTQIKVVTDKHHMKVSTASSSDTTITYLVTVDSAWWQLEDPPALSVVLWSSRTQQKLQVLVRCTGVRLDGGDQSSWMQWVVTGVAIIVGLYVLVLLTRKSSRREVTPTPPTTSPFLGPRTPPADVTYLSHNISPSHPFTPRHRGAGQENPVYGSPWRTRVD